MNWVYIIPRSIIKKEIYRPLYEVEGVRLNQTETILHLRQLEDTKK